MCRSRFSAPNGTFAGIPEGRTPPGRPRLGGARINEWSGNEVGSFNFDFYGFLSCSCGEDSTDGSKKSEIDKRINQLCSGEISSEELVAETECMNEKIYDLDMIMMCLEGIVSCDGMGITYCIDDAATCNPENCETATLNCPDSAYYHAHPRDTDGGDTYVISEALGTCTHFLSSSDWETVGTEVRACVDGECVPPSVIVERICGR